MNNRGGNGDRRYFTSGRALPEPAKQWMDSHEAEVKARNLDNPELKATYERLNELASHLQLPKYSVLAFRDLHFLRFPDSSVAGLPISDDEFLDIIEAGAYTIDELEQKLKTGEVSSPKLHSIISGLKR